MTCPSCGRRGLFQVIEKREVAEVDGDRRLLRCAGCRTTHQSIEVLVPEPYRRRPGEFVRRLFSSFRVLELVRDTISRVET
jgi:transcriptional regulator NrdR family protein